MTMRLYRVEFIHKMHDWNASFEFAAPNARTAATWARAKLASPADWLKTKARAL